MSDSNIILIAQVEQEFEAASAVAALSDAGIAASYKPTASDALLGLPGAIGCPDSFDIFIPEKSKEEAADILISIGCIKEDDDIDTSSNDAAEKTDTSSAKDQPQSLNDLMPDNPVLATVYKIILTILALAFIAGFVWLSDVIIAWFINLFR